MPYAVLLSCSKSTQKLPNETDHSLRIQSVNCYLGSNNIQVATTPQQLYLQSLDNLQRASLSFPQFMQMNRGVTDDNGVGSYALLRFGKDIPLQIPVAPGSIGSFQISFYVNWYNATNVAGSYKMNALYIYNDALITDINAKASTLKTTMLSASDVAEAMNEPAVLEDEDSVMGVSGGSFFKKLAKGFRKGKKWYKKGKDLHDKAKRAVEVIDRGANMIKQDAKDNDLFY